MSGGPASDLLATASTLWPGSVVAADGIVRRTGAAQPVRARFVVVPNSRAPRMLVPEGPPRVRAASLRRFSSASSTREVALRVLAAQAARLLPGAVLRDRIEVRGGEDGLAGHLAGLLGTEVTFSITIGNPRVNRKPVLQVFDRSGRAVAFAKLGWTETAAADVRAEAHALATLGECSFARFRHPRLIASSEWAGRPLLLMEPLGIPSWQGRSGRATPPVDAMDELAAGFRLDDGALAGSDWWRRQRQAADDIREQETRDRLGRCLDRIEELAGDRPIGWGAWHGDWTPWNMARGRSGVLVWDWERFELGVPLGLDRLHYVVNEVTERRGAAPDVVLAALGEALCARGRSGAAGHHLTAPLYLLAVATRYLVLAETPHGAPIRRRADDTLAALERSVRAA